MGYGIRFYGANDHYNYTDDGKQIESVFATLNNTHTGVLYGFIGFWFFTFSGIYGFRKLYIRNAHYRSRAPAARKWGRKIRQFFMRQGYFGLPTRAHTLVAVWYILLNCWFLIFSEKSQLQLIQLARKAGWFSVINGTLLIFLAMKNTPLSWLTGLSYEKLNVFHRWVAITALIEGGIHTIAVAVGTARLVPSQVGILLYPENVWGIITLALWILILASFYLLKRIQYETFYITHLVLFPATFIAAILHNYHSYIPIGMAFGIYFIDRAIRYNRLFWHNRYARKLKATVILTKDMMTIVKVPRGNLMWRPGTHAFLNIPSIRYFESHPFSIASVGDDIDTEGGKKTVDFIIKPEDGFTREMHAEAKKIATGVDMKKEMVCYVDGPYGALPNFNTYNKVLLYASGSGITFILPIALSIVRKARVRHLEFVWSTKKAMSYDNIRPQLEELARGGQGDDEQETYVVIRLHETDPDKKGIRRAQTMMAKMRGLQLGNMMMSGVNAVRGRSKERRRAAEEESSLLAQEEIPPVPQMPQYATTRDGRTTSNDVMPSSDPANRFSTASTINYENNNSANAPLISPDMTSPPANNPIKIHRHSGFFRAPTKEDYQVADDDDYQDLYNPPPDSDNEDEHTQVGGDDDSDSDDPEHYHNMRRRGGGDPEKPRKGIRFEEEETIEDALDKYIREGRPDMKRIIENFVNEAGTNETCAVAACGPGSDAIRGHATNAMTTNGPSISLFIEEFGW